VNPFDFSGPAFLVLLADLVPALLAGAWLLQRHLENGEIPELDLAIPIRSPTCAAAKSRSSNWSSYH
jgi:hypothetical protein